MFSQQHVPREVHWGTSPGFYRDCINTTTQRFLVVRQLHNKYWIDETEHQKDGKKILQFCSSTRVKWKIVPH